MFSMVTCQISGSPFGPSGSFCQWENVPTTSTVSGSCANPPGFRHRKIFVKNGWRAGGADDLWDVLPPPGGGCLRNAFPNCFGIKIKTRWECIIEVRSIQVAPV